MNTNPGGNMNKAALLVLAAMISGDAVASTIWLGGPVPDGGGGWLVPVHVSGLTGEEQRATQSHIYVGTTGSLTVSLGSDVPPLGSFWPAGLVQTTSIALAGTDSVHVHTGPTQFTCQTYFGSEGLLFYVPTTGAGTIGIGYASIAGEGQTGLCDGMFAHVGFSPVPIQVPPPAPVKAARSSWGRVKSHYR